MWITHKPHLFPKKNITAPLSFIKTKKPCDFEKEKIIQNSIVLIDISSAWPFDKVCNGKAIDFKHITDYVNISAILLFDKDDRISIFASTTGSGIQYRPDLIQVPIVSIKKSYVKELIFCNSSNTCASSIDSTLIPLSNEQSEDYLSMTYALIFFIAFFMVVNFGLFVWSLFQIYQRNFQNDDNTSFLEKKKFLPTLCLCFLGLGTLIYCVFLPTSAYTGLVGVGVTQMQFLFPNLSATCYLAAYGIVFSVWAKASSKGNFVQKNRVPRSKTFLAIIIVVSVLGLLSSVLSVIEGNLGYLIQLVFRVISYLVIVIFGLIYGIMMITGMKKQVVNSKRKSSTNTQTRQGLIRIISIITIVVPILLITQIILTIVAVVANLNVQSQGGNTSLPTNIITTFAYALETSIPFALLFMLFVQFKIATTSTGETSSQLNNSFTSSPNQTLHSKPSQGSDSTSLKGTQFSNE